MSEFAVALVIIVLTLAFYGEPDLHDALINHLACPRAALETLE